MEVKVNNCTLRLVKGDITKERVDAIVNAANRQLLPGGGVCGAIHRAAGEGLAKECREIGFCDTGEAVITNGYNLPTNYVIHTVGPVYSGREEDAKYLSNCYKNSLKLAVKNNLKSIAFPSISTGIFGYPVREASNVALKTIIDFLKENGKPELVEMVLFSNNDFNVYKESLENLISK
ncbi:O-acetyl-ADP-ribose deacetylase [Thermotomaculum hydrothermale]|uniref:O-acetyl-ADP-ribose deacetylase n=1 Tax=Thermotomaculum hydrothermale TaxID=981385 RepID=UPI001914E32D|nr:O-acetyl-ADP-ribose deacetylase [Thermotomaculum hydrothermale]